MLRNSRRSQRCRRAICRTGRRWLPDTKFAVEADIRGGSADLHFESAGLDKPFHLRIPDGQQIRRNSEGDSAGLGRLEMNAIEPAQRLFPSSRGADFLVNIE